MPEVARRVLRHMVQPCDLIAAALTCKLWSATIATILRGTVTWHAGKCTSSAGSRSTMLPERQGLPAVAVTIKKGAITTVIGRTAEALALPSSTDGGLPRVLAQLHVLMPVTLSARLQCPTASLVG